jgi:hypothetical protein
MDNILTGKSERDLMRQEIGLFRQKESSFFPDTWVDSSSSGLKVLSKTLLLNPWLTTRTPSRGLSTRFSTLPFGRGFTASFHGLSRTTPPIELL